nr:transposase [Algoriphagus sp.]
MGSRCCIEKAPAPSLRSIGLPKAEEWQANRTDSGRVFSCEKGENVRWSFPAVRRSVGKVDNCQVGVYASLCNDTFATLVNEKLFLPKNWVEDKNRCDKAGIPNTERIFRTKPQLALALVDECIAHGVAFDWVGADGLYGHSDILCSGLDKRGLLFVLDVHNDETVFFEEPVLAVPLDQGNRGRKPKHPKPDRQAERLDDYLTKLSENDWEQVKVRKTTKGWLCLRVHKCAVWSWNRKDAQARRRTFSHNPNRKR